MKKTHNLNGHTIKDVAIATQNFLTNEGFNGMVTELLEEDHGYRIIAEDMRSDLMAKAAGGDTRCEVILKLLDHDQLEVTVGKGSWGGKAIAAGALVAIGVLFPAGVPVIAGYAIGGAMMYTGAKTVRQVKLPTRVDEYIYHFLYDNQSSRPVEG